MANVSHASLTGTELHEPKGANSAALGTVYVSDGSGSGSWANVGTSSFTGMIADFTWPVVQAGWLELDGTDINTTTYSALYSVMTIQMNGTRVSGSPIITSLSSTANMRVGYYVFGTGIASGTTILSINSGTQITLSANAGSTGTALVVSSPWLLNAGTIRLPDVSTAGRYRRSRTSTTAVGQLQADQNQAHTHTGSGTTSSANIDHSHSFSGSTGAMSANSVHTHPVSSGSGVFGGLSQGGTGPSGPPAAVTSPSGITIDSVNLDHSHAFSGTTGGISANHQHTYSFTSSSNGGTETRPASIVVMTCVKT